MDFKVSETNKGNISYASKSTDISWRCTNMQCVQSKAENRQQNEPFGTPTTVGTNETESRR